MGGTGSADGVEERQIQGFGGKSKRPLGRPKCGWEDNIKVDLQDVECGSMNRIELAIYMYSIYLPVILCLTITSCHNNHTHTKTLTCQSGVPHNSWLR